MSGIRVIDFGHYIAGPLCGMLLADQGADVIHVIRPGCVQSHTAEYAVFNRNKRCVELDLKDTADQKAAKQLVASADVVIENFRPGVMQRFGLDAATVTINNPALVYLSLPGFASTDKNKASVRAFEGVIAAATGLFTDLQELRRLLGACPVYTPVPVASTYGAIHGATAVTLALYRRETTGCGELIEVPLAAAALSALAVINMQIDGKPSRYDAPALTESEKRCVPGWRESVQRYGDSALSEIANELIDQNQPTTANYQAACGNWIYFVGSGHGPNTRNILITLGLYEELISDGMVDMPVFDNLHLDNNIADGPGWSRPWNRHVRLRIQEKVKQQTAQAWEQVLVANGIPATAHRTSQQWLNAPETHMAGLVVDVADQIHGPIRQIGVQTTLSSSPQHLQQPKRYEDANIEDLLTVACVPKQFEADSTDSAILDGLRVLDLSNVLAGPVSGRTLAEYGAEVIKIDPPEPNFGPRISCMFPIEASPGKRSIILDIKSQRGRSIFLNLLKTADVLIHNFRPGAAEKMNIDYDTVKKIKTDIVYLNISAFNGPRPGPWGDRAGFDPVLQAATGIQLRYGGAGSPPRYHGWASCIDYITGFSGAFGVALSLFRNKREQTSNRGDLVRTSLAQGAQLVQASLLIGTAHQQPGNEPSGQESTGEHALYRMYKSADGWIFVAALRTEQSMLTGVNGFEDLSDDVLNSDEKLQCYLQAKLALNPVDYWIDVFTQLGLGVHRVESLQDICKRYRHEGSSDALQSTWNDGRTLSWVRYSDHPAGSAVELSAPAYAKLQKSTVRLLSPTPKQGAHTREVLTEIGYSEETISELLKDGVIKEQLHEKYLPA